MVNIGDQRLKWSLSARTARLATRACSSTGTIRSVSVIRVLTWIPPASAREGNEIPAVGALLAEDWGKVRHRQTAARQGGMSYQ
ncbi:hypothetical protein GCM10010442_53120 [Kitasatospora kifunensis]